MPWGASFHPSFSLRLAAVASLVFWLGQLCFVAVELSFDPADPAAQWWLGPFADRVIMTVWLAACAATVATLFAMRAERRRLRRWGGRGRKLVPATALTSPGKEGQCSV